MGLDEFSDLLFGEKKIALETVAMERIDLNFRFLRDFSADKLIYGINTGFGPMAQYRIKEEDLLQLQYNLIRSHSSGNGKTLPASSGKAVMIARLNSLMQGYSGVHTEAVELLAAMINKNIIPCIYERGGVGASGDLVQLAHLALSLIGEGEVLYEGGVHPTADILSRHKLKPLSIHIREGLAILNGTSAMTGIGLLNILQAKKLLGWSVLLSALTNEIVEAYDDHYSYELNIIKHHKGQNRVAAMLRELLKDSKLIRSRSEHLYHAGRLEESVFEEKVQEYYSLRCITQVLGPVMDTISQSEKIVTDELNSVNDNPVIDHVNQNIFHGGNFHGDYVALEMDKLKTAITKLSMLSERQLNFLLNDKLNQKFPPFVNLGVLGLNFGMQGMQFTAVSTVAENQTLSFPMYVHSIPNNNDNQDIVSMGCNAALMTQRVIENSFAVLAIQAMTLCQAVDHADCVPRLAADTRSFYREVRKLFPKFVGDAPKYKELEKVKGFLESTDPADLITALA
jgi:histidine ammonia-lyase